MRKGIISLLIFLTFALPAIGQNTDSISTKTIYKKSIFPVALIGAGVLLSGSDFEHNLNQDMRDAVGSNYQVSIDDYAQYAPVATLYLADILRIKSKNHWFDQTKYLLISNAISAGITQSLKGIIGKTRPNGSDYAMPSGHTTLAFTNAAVVYNEFSETAPLVAYSGYAFAVTTGTFRMLNNKHWFSDVLVGAGIGIAVTRLVYYFEPLKNFNPFKKAEGVALVPYANSDEYGFYFSYRF